MKPSADPLSVAPADVLAMIFRTDFGREPAILRPTPLTFDLSPYAGQTVRLRFALVSNQFCFPASVDDIDVRSRNVRPSGPTCTIRGTNGNDVFRGTPGMT